MPTGGTLRYDSQPDSGQRSTLERDFDIAVLNGAIVDFSDYGRIALKGKDGLDLLHRLSTNDLSGMKAGDVRTTILTTEKGRILDLVAVMVVQQDVWLITSPGKAAAVKAWIDKFTIAEDVSLTDLSSEGAMFCIRGRNVDSLMKQYAQIEFAPSRTLRIEKSYGSAVIAIAMVAGTKSFFLIVPRTAKTAAADELGQFGANFGVSLVGPELSELLRISEGIPGPGRELAGDFHPLEAGLRDAISFTKGCYIGQEVIARLETYQKVRRSLIGTFLAAPPGSKTGPLRIFNGAAEIGLLTSWSGTPVHGRYIGLAIASGTEEGGRFELRGESGTVTGEFTGLPIRFV